MAKRAFGEDKETVEKMKEEVKADAAKEIPQLTFTEADVQKVANFINYMYLNAEFKGGMKEFKNINQMFADVHAHIKVMESHIFEVKKISTAKKAME
jgi:hypothetical protein